MKGRFLVFPAILAAAFAALGAAPSPAPEGGTPEAAAGPRFIAADQEGAVRKLLDVGEPLSGGRSFDASIAKDRIVLTAGPAGQRTMGITLVHPSMAPEGSRVVADLAILPEPGPAPPELVDELARRMEASGVTIAWTTPQASRRTSPRPPPPPDSPDEPARLTPLRVVFFLAPLLSLLGWLAVRRWRDRRS